MGDPRGEPPVPVGVRVGEYEIRSLLGRGGMVKVAPFAVGADRTDLLVVGTVDRCSQAGRFLLRYSEIMVSHKLPPFEIREVPDREGGLILELRANGLRLATARATADIIASMGMGRDEVRKLLESSLSDLPLKPELERQVFGYWFGPGEDIPPAPVGSPTGAVLPRQTETIKGAELICLDLVPVHNYWLVLSEPGRYTYRHTSGLLVSEEWRFVPVADAAGNWPVVFVTSFAESIPPADIDKHYGFEASTRARIDAPAVQLHFLRRP